MAALDFSAIAQAALRAGPGLVMAWLPGGRLHGAEYDVLNPTRADQTTGNFPHQCAHRQVGRFCHRRRGRRSDQPVGLSAAGSVRATRRAILSARWG